LKRSGYAGEGFFSKGHQLGENVSHNLPADLARIRALEAAEKRRRTSAILSGGGRLGGRPIGVSNLSPRELAARVCTLKFLDYHP
jgi:DNA-dependent metalloprotease WSS1